LLVYIRDGNEIKHIFPDKTCTIEGENMVFIYYSQGVASQYQDFTERLMSHLALKGTEITGQVLKETTAQMHVKHTDEQGHLDISVENDNVKVSYTVDRERKEISKGVAGAVAGAGLGGLIGNILRHDQGVGDALAGALGGAATGGAYGAYSGWEESRNERTEFAAVLAQTIKEVEDELQYIIQGQQQAKEAVREKGRQKLEEDNAKADEFRGMLEDLYGQVLAVQEEIEMAGSEGTNITKPKGRIDRAENLYKEAQESFDKKEYGTIKPKITAAQNMVDKAREALSQAQSGS
jgi:outer membrane lipoprotein SlyB